MHADKRSVPSVAVLVNQFCQDTFTGACFAAEQHRAFGGGHRTDFIENIFHFVVIRMHDLPGIHFPKLIVKVVQLGLENNGFFYVFNYIFQFMRIDRIGDVVTGACLDGRDRFTDGLRCSHDDDLNGRVQVPERL